MILHDLGRILVDVDVAVALADGVTTISEIAVLAVQHAVFGATSSPLPTTYARTPSPSSGTSAFALPWTA